MGIPKISLDPMNVAEFFQFTEGRPDNEKWELIDGQARMNASASQLHHIIQLALGSAVMMDLRRSGNRLVVSPGIGVRVADGQMPIPDLVIRPRSQLERRDCDDAIVVVEILSPSTATLDLRWKRMAYGAVASIQHYVVIAQDAVDIIVFDRATGFTERRITDAAASLDLPACGVVIPLAEIYRDTGLL